MARSDAYIRVSCDRCANGPEEEIELTPIARRGWDGRDVDASLRDAGWSKDGEEDLCPNCTEERADA